MKWYDVVFFILLILGLLLFFVFNLQHWPHSGTLKFYITLAGLVYLALLAFRVFPSFHFLAIGLLPVLVIFDFFEAQLWPHPDLPMDGFRMLVLGIMLILSLVITLKEKHLNKQEKLLFSFLSLFLTGLIIFYQFTLFFPGIALKLLKSTLLILGIPTYISISVFTIISRSKTFHQTNLKTRSSTLAILTLLLLGSASLPYNQLERQNFHENNSGFLDAYEKINESLVNHKVKNLPIAEQNFVSQEAFIEAEDLKIQVDRVYNYLDSIIQTLKTKGELHQMDDAVPTLIYKGEAKKIRNSVNGTLQEIQNSTRRLGLDSLAISDFLISDPPENNYPDTWELLKFQEATIGQALMELKVQQNNLRIAMDRYLRTVKKDTGDH